MHTRQLAAALRFASCVIRLSRMFYTAFFVEDNRCQGGIYTVGDSAGLRRGLARADSICIFSENMSTFRARTCVQVEQFGRTLKLTGLFHVRLILSRCAFAFCFLSFLAVMSTYIVFYGYRIPGCSLAFCC